VRLYKPLQTPGANWAAATAVTLIAQQVAGKAARDALFLSSFSAARLPLVMGSAAIISLAAVVALARAMSRWSPAALLPLLLSVSASAFVAEWSLSSSAPRAAAVLVYLHTALFGPTLTTTFWSLINERFDPHAAKRAVARIAGGGTLGGVLGGLAAWRASTIIALPTLLLLLACLNAAATIGSLLTTARRREKLALAAPEAIAGVVSPIRELVRAPFLRNLAILVGVGACTSTLLDYVFSAQAAAVYGKGTPLLYFFSLFWLGVSVLSFVLQITLGRFALERLGIAISIAVLPGVIIMGGAVGLAVPGLVSAAILRGAEAVQRNTLFRSAYELLYTPLSAARKRATKAVIDVGFDRVGTMLGSGLAIVSLHFFAPHTPAVLLGTVVVLALLTLPLVRQLHVGYVDALEESLRNETRKLELSSEPVVRPTIELRQREKLIEQVEAMQPGGLSAMLASEEGTATGALEEGGRARAVLDDPGAVLDEAGELLSADTTRAGRALAQLSTQGLGASCAIVLLAHPALHLQAITALRTIAGAITGQLIDRLLDPTCDFVVRRRVPRILSACPSQRSADGLLLGLADERFEVRYQCGRALLRITEAGEDVVVGRDKVIEVVQLEVDRGRAMLEKARREDFDDDLQADDQSSLMATLMQDRVDRSLEHLFTLLSLHLEREPLRMAFRALHHDDSRHRGTALEYLETVLPAEVREAIWPYLGEDAILPSVRTTTEILADLASVPASPARPDP
jgi:AAA family ATP:ADP antiporter